MGKDKENFNPADINESESKKKDTPPSLDLSDVEKRLLFRFIGKLRWKKSKHNAIAIDSLITKGYLKKILIDQKKSIYGYQVSPEHESLILAGQKQT